MSPAEKLGEPTADRAATVNGLGRVEALAARAREVRSRILDDIIGLVEVESGTRDTDAVARAACAVENLVVRRLGDADAVTRSEGGGAFSMRFDGDGGGTVALLAHYDTVWPVGTIAEWSPTVSSRADGRTVLHAPGGFDTKGGLAQGIWALALARESGESLPSVLFVFNGDEERGSPDSRSFIEDAARCADATLVLESAGEGGAVKTGRKGVGQFSLRVTGVESHAGLDPALGASAVHALAEIIGAVREIAHVAEGVTVNVGTMSGGTAPNVVGGRAEAEVDVRIVDPSHRTLVDEAFAALAPRDPRVKLVAKADWSRPPMSADHAHPGLLGVVRSVSQELGRDLVELSVGGGSDANFVAGLGLPVVCGLGAIGGGAHARGEFVVVDEIPHQTALVAGVLLGLAHSGSGEDAR